ncbi:MAG: hypothetical protein KO206_04020 [Methanomicrobiaceae archaeon]|nr:hypothetical protein [Methanomicrobiaceae archaeon]MDD5419563.1 hypothetical protein [Methanomicrobiaceae archaeon]
MFEDSSDTYSYKGWLVSDSFLKRAFAVFGYNLVAGLIIWLLLAAIFLILALILAAIGIAAYGISGPAVEVVETIQVRV